jgi:hypothetical protein
MERFPEMGILAETFLARTAAVVTKAVGGVEKLGAEAGILRCRIWHRNR